MIMERVKALTRLIARFPDMIDHGIPRPSTRVHAIGDSLSPWGWSDGPDLDPTLRWASREENIRCQVHT